MITLPIIDTMPNTAGARLTSNIPIIKVGSTLSDINALLSKAKGAFDTIKNVYIVDDENTLTGVILSREIFRHPPHTKIETVCIDKNNICTVLDTDDQEIAVKKASAMNVESVAVITANQKFVGAISVKELLKILQEETQEDLAAEGHFDMSPALDSILEIPLRESIISRAPWIMLGLLGGIAAAGIIGGFEELLTEHIILAGYIPLAVYITGAVSAQVQMGYIRDTSLNPALPFLPYLIRQSQVVVALTFILSIILLGIGLFIEDMGTAAYAVTLGIGISILSAILTGVIVPKLLAMVVKDPANATAPISTIISDTITIITFFSIAHIFLG